MSYEAIPDALKERDQWVCWEEATRNGKLTKIPKRPDAEGNAKSNDPETWGPFEQAVATAELHDWGIGFMFAEDGPYLGVDLDSCLNDRGGPASWLPSISPFLQETYIEESPSGTGLHVILRDVEVPDWWTNCEEDVDDDTHRGVEVYEDGRFFTFTAAAIDMSAESVPEFDQSTFRDWLLDAWDVFHDEPPRLPGEKGNSPAGTSGPPTGGGDDINITVSDVLGGGYPEGERTEHPFHGSSTGSNFMVDEGGETWRCWRHGVTGNALHLIGLEQGVIDCGDWEHGGLDSDTWSAIFDAGREAGYDLPEKVVTDGREAAENADDWETVRWLYRSPEVEQKHARHAAFLQLMDSYEFMTTKDTKTTYVYDPETGVYEPEGAQVIEEELLGEVGANYTQHERKEILGKVRASTYIDRDDFDAGDDPRQLVCVGNGVLDLEKRELLEHSPEYHFTRGIPVDYDPDARPENIDEFMDDITRREVDKRTIYEMVGNCLTPHYHHSAFMVLFGEGENGKSTFFDVLEHFLGEDNVSGYELQKLAENRFATASLPGKLANIAPDLPNRKLTETGTLKSLTGGDTVMAEEKGEPAFEFTNTAKLLFGANRPPALGEQSHAIMRRLLPIPLPYSFTHAEDDGNPMARPRGELMDELTASEELSGLLNAALDGLERLRETGQFSLPETPEERGEIYEQYSDPIKQFNVRCLDNEAGEWLPKSAVYEAYKRFSAANDYEPRSRQVFFQQLRQTSFTYDEYQPRTEDGRVRALKTATFTETGMEYCDDLMLRELGVGASEPDDTDDTDDVTPLADVAPAGNPFYTVEVEVTSFQEKDKGPAYEAVLKDDSGTLEMIDWDGVRDLDGLEEDSRYLLRDVKATYDKDGTLQLQPVPNTTNWVLVETDRPDDQQAITDPGESDADPGGSGSETTRQSADEPSQEQIRDRVVMTVQKEQDKGNFEGVGVDTVLDELEEQGIDRDRAEHQLEKQLREGRLYEPVEGRVRTT